MRFLNESASAVNPRTARGFLAFAQVLGGGDERVGVAADDAVGEVHDARGVLLGEFGVVRDHDDQPFARDLLDEIHDLHAGIRIERAGRFVGEQDLGIVDQGARDGDALHLPARKLVGLFIDMFFEPHAHERLPRAFLALRRGDARKGERKFHVSQNRLMRNEIVRLKYESDTVIAVSVPVFVVVIFGGSTADDEIAARIVIQPADDIQKGGLAATRMSENGHEFVFAERKTDAFERVHDGIGNFVVLDDVFQFQHCFCHNNFSVIYCPFKRWGSFPRTGP